MRGVPDGRTTRRFRAGAGAVAIAAAAAVFVTGLAAPSQAVPATPSTAADHSIALPGAAALMGTGPATDASGDVWMLVTTGVEEVRPDGTLVNFPTTAGRVAQGGITVDTAGDAWYVDNENPGASYVSEVTAAGVVHDYPDPLGPATLVSGPDGTVWLLGRLGGTFGGGVVRYTSSGTVTQFSTPQVVSHAFLPDGTLWFGGDTTVGWITPTQTSTTIGSVTVPSTVQGMVVDASGTVWFDEQGAIGAVAPDHSVSSYPVPGGKTPTALVLGSDGDPWFTDTGSLLVAGTAPLEYTVRTGGVLASVSFGLGNYATVDTPFVGPDGRLWLTAHEQGQTTGTSPVDLLRIATDGTVTRTSEPGDYSLMLRTSPNGTVWFQTSNYGFAPAPALTGVIAADGSMQTLASQSGQEFGTVFDSAGRAWGYDPSTNMLHEYWPVATTRVSASDRFATSVAVAQREYPNTAPTVVVASGMNFPDGLSAGPVAAADGGPLLLTGPTTLPQAVSAEITHLAPTKILVIGGPAAVSDDVVAQLNAIAPVTRLSGADRYATSRALVSSAFGGGASTVYVATGANFPDALSAGGAAGSQGAPLLLVDGTESTLDDATAQLLQSLHVQHIELVGGTSAVSPGVAAGLGAIAPVARLSGADRYSTAVAVNQQAYAGAPAGASVLIATGSSFPDALSASAWAAAAKSPLYVAAPGCVPQPVLGAIGTMQAGGVSVVGGPSALSDGVLHLTGC
ncbi:cell wall-binding repeat-containing protein [Leifsonia sp. NPDC056665]|uniref:cell wall-binding repeat-containing protein n=1 Tax=Leifsonia sp. NPDC056665 TaxID=3345901 RepID=UPI00369E7555